MNAKLVMNLHKLWSNQTNTTTMYLVMFLATVFINQAYATRFAPQPAPQASSTKFSFEAFNTQSCSSSSNLRCIGAASAGDGFLSLTPEHSALFGSKSSYRNNVGKVLYNQPVVAWPAIVSTAFTYRIVGASNSPSKYGMTFIMTSNSDLSLGDSIGFNFVDVGQPNTESVDATIVFGHQLTVEFDTYKNDFDIDGNHITDNTTSVEKSSIAKSLNNSGIDLKIGKDIKVQIDYNSWANWVEVYAGYDSDPLVKISSEEIHVEGTLPNFVYVGFIAATGYFTESHQILSWEFSSLTK